jgi:Ca2+-binding RTX toxin-like protein
MATINVTTHLTVIQSLNDNDILYVAARGSIFTAGNAIAMASINDNNTTVAIDGTVVGVNDSAAVLLNGTTAGGDASGAGSHLVTIGATGVVRTLNAGFGVYTRGGANSITNNGLIDAATSGIVNNGGTSAILNAGRIMAQSDAINQVGNQGVLTNTGDISSAYAAAMRTFGDASILHNTGTLEGFQGILLVGDSNTIWNAGVITATIGVDCSGTDNTLTNTADGRILGTSRGVTINGGGTQHLVNAGSITGAVGIDVGAQATLLANSGLIEGVTGQAVEVTNTVPTTALTLTNTGTIRAAGAVAILGNAGVEAVRNTGIIIGGIALAGGADVVTNTGIIRGDVDLGAGADRLMAVEGRIFGSILCGAGNDTVVGGAQADTVLGGADNDLLLGGAGDDVLLGGAGLDRIIGGLGNDRITAGAGTDVLTGGAGADVFVFTSKATIGIGVGRDQITDFAHGVDDLSMVFMNSFIGAAGFTAAGQVRYVQATGLLSGSTDADTAAEWTLLLVNKPVITAGDFVF